MSSKVEESNIKQTFDKNGKLREEKTYVNGKLNGLYRRWYDNGQLEEEKTYKDGEVIVISREWSKEGQLVKEKQKTDTELIIKYWYDNDDKINNQLYREDTYSYITNKGKNKTWYENGKKWTIEPYKNGEKHGICRYWNEDGILDYHASTVYKDGQYSGVLVDWCKNKDEIIELYEDEFEESDDEFLDESEEYDDD